MILIFQFMDIRQEPGDQNIADDLLEGKGLAWRYPCKNLANDGLYCEL